MTCERWIQVNSLKLTRLFKFTNEIKSLRYIIITIFAHLRKFIL